MAGATNQTSTIAGAVQRFINREWMNQPRRKYMGPLANHRIGVPGNIPKHNGQVIEFRKFTDFSVPSNGTDDSPKKYAENDGDPSTGQSHVAVTVELPLASLRDFCSLGKMVSATDAVDLAKLTRDLFRVQQGRWIHRWVNDCFVKKILDTNTYGATPISEPLKTIYAQGAANFGQLNKESTFETADFKRAYSILNNAGVPKFFGSRYAAFVDEAICSQLESDPNFKEAVLRGWNTSKVLGGMQYIDIYGMLFIKQNDEYRAALGGALTTRADAGAVHVAHVLGPQCFAYLDLGSKKNRTSAPFKVQDITTTGVIKTIGWDIPFQASVIDRDFGLNIAGCTNWDETLDDIA